MAWNIGASQNSGWDIGASQTTAAAPPAGHVPTADLQGSLWGPLGGSLMFKNFIYGIIFGGIK